MRAVMKMRIKYAKFSRPFQLLPTESLLPCEAQPRRQYDEAAEQSLTESIRENGILQPLTVRKTPDGYRLIAGERRLSAARRLGLSRVPCMVVPADGQTAALLSLLENLQRRDLTCFEEAEGLYRLLHTWGFSREDAAARLGMAQSTLANKLRLLRLTPWQRERIEGAGLSERHARALLRIEDPEERSEVLLQLIARGLTVAETEQLVTRTLEAKQAPAAPRRKSIVGDARLFANTIDHALSAIQRAGVEARAQKTENDEYIEYTIRIAKTRPGGPVALEKSG